jgi:predicted alpha-1,6-mannanase (GH76 family)
MYLFVLENMYETTGDTRYRRQVQAHWNYVKAKWGDALTTCGFASPATPSPCQDDAAWSLWMLLKIYSSTHDPYALQCAEGLASTAYKRWHDASDGGGMWYSDYWNDPSNAPHYHLKSLYQSGMTLGFLKLWELTRKQVYRAYADDCYNWLQKTLLRTDGLYWNSVNAQGLPDAHPGAGMYSIGEGGSVTYLGGDMAMAVLNARYYRITGIDSYRQSAMRTANSIRMHLTNANGVLIDDMDLWTNGVFATEYTTEVLTLPGIDKRDVAAFQKTATSIYRLDRTSDGYYGPCWDGPIGSSDGTGTQTPWSSVGKPNQIMTSANAVNMIVAAASYPSQPQPLRR